MRGWMLRSEQRRRRLRETVALAAAATCAAAIAAPAAGAATWGYEQVTPHDSETSEPIGIAVSEDLGTTFVGSLGDPIPGQPSDGRSGVYYYGLPHGGQPWLAGPVDATTGPQIISNIEGLAADGSGILIGSADDLLDEGTGGGSVYLFRSGSSWFNVTGPAGPATSSVVATRNLDRVAVRPNTDANVHLFTAGGGRQVVSVDDDGNPMDAAGVGGAGATSDETYRSGAMTADGSSLIFGSTTALDGDADTSLDVYRRVLTPGAEETILISDDTPGADADPGADALYRWSSPDHQTVLFHTTGALGDGDSDTAADLYIRTGTGPLERVTKGETIDVSGTPTETGNANGTAGDVDWVATSESGDRIYFLSRERLTQDAPAGNVWRLYERDLGDDVTRFVAGPLPTAEASTNAARGFISNRDLDTSFRPLRIIPGGVVFQTAAQLAGDTDSLVDVFRWTRSGGLQLLSAPEAGAPPSPAAAAQILAINPSRFEELAPVRGGRVVTADGSRVFLTTAESLTAEDTDGGYADVYVWSEADGLRLVTAFGDDPYDATYLDSSPDGTRVWFQTAATVLASDGDPNTIDTYLAVLDGGQAPSKPAPPQGPSGPPMSGGSAGGGTGIPAPAPPPSAGPLPPETTPPPVVDNPGDRGGGGSHAQVELRPVRTVKGGTAVLRIVPSTGGELRVRATARLKRKGRAKRVGSASETVKAGPVRVSVELSRRAQRRLEDRGRLRVRFRVRLNPSDGAPVTERTTVTLRSGERR